MTEINDNTPCVGGGWRGVRDALAKRDRWRKFLTNGHPDGVMLPYYGGGDIRYYWLNLKRKSDFLFHGGRGRKSSMTTET